MLNEIQTLESEIEETFKKQFNYELLIVNYETLVNEDVKSELHKKHIKYIFSDEIHMAKSYKAQRSKALYEFGDAKYTIGATATPIQKNYEDIYGIFKFVKTDLWVNFSRFANRYIKYFRPGMISGYRNIDELRSCISPYLFIKSKEEISNQLPKLNVIQRYCTLDEKVVEQTQNILAEITDLHEQEKQIKLKCHSEKDMENNYELQQVESKIMALQAFAQELADEPDLLLLSESDLAKQYYIKPKYNAKMNLLLSLVEEILDSEEKVCIFSRFERMQDILINNLQKLDSSMYIAKINGSMNDEQRYEQVYTQFRDNKDCKILIASEAGSTGLNLQIAKYIIEYDLADSYAIQTQRHGRIERADSLHKNVFVYQLIAKDSYDEIALKIVNKKEDYDYELIKKLKE